MSSLPCGKRSNRRALMPEALNVRGIVGRAGKYHFPLTRATTQRQALKRGQREDLVIVIEAKGSFRYLIPPGDSRAPNRPIGYPEAQNKQASGLISVSSLRS
jgi:hypothetical protein